MRADAGWRSWGRFAVAQRRQRDGIVQAGRRGGRLAHQRALRRVHIADQLRLLADLAADLRLTPFRAVLLPGAPATILSRLAEAGLTTRPDDPLRFVAACPGAPACASAAIETRDLARRLAALNPAAGDVWLHVSGCDKSCASSAAHAVTLVGRDGTLDLVLEGRPRDAPRLAGLTPEAVEAVLRSGMLIR